MLYWIYLARVGDELTNLVVIGTDTVLYNATKTLLFASYFCKMRVKIMYWSPDGELMYLENFRSLIIFFNLTFDFDYTVFYTAQLTRT